MGKHEENISLKETSVLKIAKLKRPWSGKFDTKLKKFKWTLDELCRVNGVTAPSLHVQNNEELFDPPLEYDGETWFDERLIRLRCFSMTALLHETKHWIDKKKRRSWKTRKLRDKREWDAINYSIVLFYTVWRERLKQLDAILEMIARNGVVVNMDTSVMKNPEKHGIATIINKANNALHL